MKRTLDSFSSARCAGPSLLMVALVLWSPRAGTAQDGNIPFRVDSVEYLLARATFRLPDALVGMRFAEDRTQRVPLWYEDDTGVLVKWAEAPRGGETFNNNPRYEIAAYELQKLFLDGTDYVVPPTVPRMLPLSWYRTVDEGARRTFKSGSSVLVVLQFYLYNVTTRGVWDKRRFRTDSVYARHWADANLLTYLIGHKDANSGNLMISTDSANPRVFSVDNGVAFRSPRSDRGTRWSRLQVDRFPHGTVERLRALRREDLDRALGVLAQFELRGDALVRMEPTDNWKPSSGIRERKGVVQLGLTEGEIDDVWGRVGSFLKRVDQGRLEVF